MQSQLLCDVCSMEKAPMTKTKKKRKQVESTRSSAENKNGKSTVVRSTFVNNCQEMTIRNCQETTVRNCQEMTVRNCQETTVRNCQETIAKTCQETSAKNCKQTQMTSYQDSPKGVKRRHSDIDNISVGSKKETHYFSLDSKSISLFNSNDTTLATQTVKRKRKKKKNKSSNAIDVVGMVIREHRKEKCKGSVGKHNKCPTLSDERLKAYCINPKKFKYVHLKKLQDEKHLKLF